MRRYLRSGANKINPVDTTGFEASKSKNNRVIQDGALTSVLPEETLPVTVNPLKTRDNKSSSFQSVEKFSSAWRIAIAKYERTLSSSASELSAFRSQLRRYFSKPNEFRRYLDEHVTLDEQIIRTGGTMSSSPAKGVSAASSSAVVAPNDVFLPIEEAQIMFSALSEETNSALESILLLPIESRASRLLFLFIVDILAQFSGRVVCAKSARDNFGGLGDEEANRHWHGATTSTLHSAVIWSVLCVLNVAAFLYTSVQVSTSANLRQELWFHCLLLWLVLEPLVVNPLLVLFFNMFLPSLAVCDINSAKLSLYYSIKDHQRLSRKAKITAENDASSTPGVAHNILGDKEALSCPTEVVTAKNNAEEEKEEGKLNFAPLCMVSYAVAKELPSHPALKVGSIIQSFDTSTSMYASMLG